MLFFQRNDFNARKCVVSFDRLFDYFRSTIVIAQPNRIHHKLINSFQTKFFDSMSNLMVQNIRSIQDIIIHFVSANSI